MKILAFEFSSPQRSVAVLAADSAHEAVESLPGNAMKPLTMVETVLRQAGLEREQIEVIAVGIGPGSYTGIRTAIALAQGWQLATNVKLLAVSSVEAIVAEAAAAGVSGAVSVVIDAQRGEFYLAGYEVRSGDWRATTALRIVSREEVQARLDAGEALIGPEVTQWFPAGRLIFPRAEQLGRLAQSQTNFLPGDQIEPIYLREAKFVKAPPARVI